MNYESLLSVLYTLALTFCCYCRDTTTLIEIFYNCNIFIFFPKLKHLEGLGVARSEKRRGIVIYYFTKQFLFFLFFFFLIIAEEKQKFEPAGMN